MYVLFLIMHTQTLKWKKYAKLNHGYSMGGRGGARIRVCSADPWHKFLQILGTHGAQLLTKSGPWGPG